MCNIFTCYLYNSVYKRLGMVYLKRMYIIISYTKLSERQNTGKKISIPQNVNINAMVIEPIYYRYPPWVNNFT